MQPAQGDIALRRNAPFVEEWFFADQNGNPIDFTGWSARLEIRLYGRQPGDAYASLGIVGSETEGVRVIADDRGVLRVRIAQATADALPSTGEIGSTDRFVYDLAMIDPSGFRQIFREGAVITNPGVTL